MSSPYDARHIERFFDDYGEREWSRLGPESSALHRVNFHIHRSYLDRYVKPGWRVLEAGAGAGRFTLELARLGTRVTVGDLSSRQLEINQDVCRRSGILESIEGFAQIDITDLSRFPDGEFDAVVCYGGPLSYVFDQAQAALDQMLRVTRPGGLVMLSVMSLIGSTQSLLARIFESLPVEKIATVLEGGDLTDMGDHRLRMYRWSTLQALVSRGDCRLLAATASGHLCVGNEETAAKALDDDSVREHFLEWELRLCAEPGALDGGTHILVVLEKPL